MGLSIKEISSFLNIKITSYYKYENGTRFPKPYMILDLWNKYSINLNYLFSGEGDIVVPKKSSCNVPADLQELCMFADRYPEVKKVLLAEMDKLKVYLADKFKDV